MSIDLITATSDSFSAYVGQTFVAQDDAGPVRLILDNIKVFEGSTIRDNTLHVDGTHYPARQAFALTFEGPRTPVLSSDTRILQHEVLGALVVFLSPFRQDHSCTLYEVTFN